MFNRVPLAWLQLTHEKVRLMAAVAGISFAVVLMLFQLGLLDALFAAASLVQDRLQGELVMTSNQYQYLLVSKNFSQRRLYQALSFDGVESVAPVYLGISQWKNPESLTERNILTVGYNPLEATFSLPEGEDPRKLLLPDVAFFDALSRPEFGPVPQLLTIRNGVDTEVNGRRIKVVGLFRLGPSFGIDGAMVTSDLNFLRLLPLHPKGLIEVGMIRVKRGADTERVRLALEKNLPPDVRILKREVFMDREKAYWSASTGIGYIFSLGVLIGFVVGAVIVYQILYTDVNDHLAEFATLKALGYRDFYLASVVVRQSLLLSVFGFLPGLAIAKVLYSLTAKATYLPMTLHAGRTFLVLSLTMLMCAGSALLAVRKLRQADPADIF